MIYYDASLRQCVIVRLPRRRDRWDSDSEMREACLGLWTSRRKIEHDEDEDRKSRATQMQ